MEKSNNKLVAKLSKVRSFLGIKIIEFDLWESSCQSSEDEKVFEKEPELKEYK